MEALMQKTMQQAAAMKKDPSSVPWQADEQWTQPCYSWSTEKQSWQPVHLPVPRQSASGITSLVLYTWNIDVMLPCAEARMSAALAHLEELTKQLESPESTAVVIYLQECIVSDLDTIGQKPWIRERFYVTDVDHTGWASAAYGTTMLVDRRLDISSCFRIHYSKTQMQRDALFVDFALPSSSSEPPKTIRLCNTHLESLALEPPFRPAQMHLIAQHMHAKDISGAAVAGDFNAIQPFDETLASENNLRDAYLELGGAAGADEGNTWGQQALRALRERFGCTRMDRVYFCGRSLALASLERFGAGVVLGEAEAEQRDELLGLGFEEAWITDHLGVKAVFNFTNGHNL